MNFDPIVGNWETLQPIRALAMTFCALAFNSICLKTEAPGTARRSAAAAKLGFLVMTIGYLSALWDRSEVMPLHALLINVGVILVALRTMAMYGHRLRLRSAERNARKVAP